jgi:signal transduction histidine kinase
LALALAEKNNDIEAFGLTYDNIGALFEDKGDYQKALFYYLKELEAEKKIGVKIYIAEALGSISGAYLKLKEYNKALEYAKDSYSMSEEIQSAEQRAIAAGILSNAYEGLKNFDQSLYFLRIEYDISDSLYSIEKTKTVANLASHYELSKKEAEIKMLQFEKQAQHTQLKQESRFRIMLVAFLVVVIIMLVIAVYLYQSRKKANDMLMVWSRAVDQKNQELDNLNKVKDKIFSSIAHDVRSPLASIQGLLSLMNYEILSPEELQRMTIELSAKVNTTSSLLENLLNWSRNQIATAKANPVKSDIKKLADDCIALYSSNASEKNIKLQNNIPTDSTVFVDEEMILIVFRNLISN